MKDLEQSPPLPYDLARQLRVLSTQFQFVEFSLLRAALARKRVPVPPDLLGLAKDSDTEDLLRASFQLVTKEDEVSGDKLLKRRDSIDKEHLCTIAHYGKVILKSNRTDFDQAVDALKTDVNEFRKGALPCRHVQTFAPGWWARSSGSGKQSRAAGPRPSSRHRQAERFSVPRSTATRHV